MKSRMMVLGILYLLLTQMPVQGQETQVKVLKGKVRAQTNTADVTVSAGQKGILAEGKNPMVTVDEPMVNDLVEMYKWVKEEKAAGNPPFQFSNIQIVRIDTQDLWSIADLAEGQNTTTEPLETIKLGLTSILEDPTYYNMEGNIIPFELEQTNPQQGYYYLHFPKPIPPGEAGGYISVSKYRPSSTTLWKEGPLWLVSMGNCSANFLNYFRVILPESAIFVTCSRPILMVESVQGRTAVTIRNITGEDADGMYQIAFLWPALDGTTLADLPAQYRGLREQWEIELANEYQDTMERILAGELFEDYSTPLRSLLTMNSAIAHRNKDLLVKTSYVLTTNPQLIEKFAENMDRVWQSMENQYRNHEFLGCPPFPEKPEENCLHPIYMARKGSLLREDTFAFIYTQGKWLYMGNMGNSYSTDVNSFEKMLTKVGG